MIGPGLPNQCPSSTGHTVSPLRREAISTGCRDPQHRPSSTGSHPLPRAVSRETGGACGQRVWITFRRVGRCPRTARRAFATVRRGHPGAAVRPGCAGASDAAPAGEGRTAVVPEEVLARTAALIRVEFPPGSALGGFHRGTPSLRIAGRQREQAQSEARTDRGAHSARPRYTDDGRGRSGRRVCCRPPPHDAHAP